MFAVHGLLDQRLRKLFLLCLVFSCLPSINPQWAVAQDNPQKGGGFTGFVQRLWKNWKALLPSTEPTSTTSTSPTPTSPTPTSPTPTSPTPTTPIPIIGLTTLPFSFMMMEGTTASTSQTF